MSNVTGGFKGCIVEYVWFELHPIAVTVILKGVDCLILATNNPFEANAPAHVKSAGIIHCEFTKLFGLKTPKAASTPNMTVIMAIAQPYVIRNSIALWAFGDAFISFT